MQPLLAQCDTLASHPVTLGAYCTPCHASSPRRILYKLDELVRPYVHKILVVIEPLLIDEDYYARVEGREIIANLSKAAGAEGTGFSTHASCMARPTGTWRQCQCKRKPCVRSSQWAATRSGFGWCRKETLYA